MNERTQRIVKAPDDCKPAAQYDPSNPTVAVELQKTLGLLQRALEVADTIASRLRPSPMGKDTGRPTIGGIVGDAQLNHELAGDVCNRLDEIASVLG